MKSEHQERNIVMRAITLTAVFLFVCVIASRAESSDSPKPDPSCKYEIVTHTCSSAKRCKTMQKEFEADVTRRLREGWRLQGGFDVMLREDMGPDERVFRQGMTYNCEPIGPTDKKVQGDVIDQEEDT